MCAEEDRFDRESEEMSPDKDRQTLSNADVSSQKHKYLPANGRTGSAAVCPSVRAHSGINTGVSVAEDSSGFESEEMCPGQDGRR